jgi:prepilin-type N-terminal cleavage/methylation domain-containing protein
MNRKGFTLMELLIVIGVLGILAAGVMAAIDPFEQLKKARDATNRNAAVELLNGFQRYYATHEDFPWNQTGTYLLPECDTSEGVGALADWEIPSGDVVLDATTMQDCITAALITQDAELKDSFFEGVSGDKLFINSSDETHVMVCFAPESKGERVKPNTNYLMDSEGENDELAVDTEDPPTCPGSEAGVCYQCFK